MATLTVTGTLRGANSTPLSGKVVELHNSAHSNLDQDTTDGSGNYSIGPIELSPGTYHTHFDAVAAHGGQSTTIDHGTSPTSVARNITLPDAAPTAGTMSSKSYSDETGSYTEDFTMADTDPGDVLTPVKVAGPSFATISKVNNTTGRWTVNTDHATFVPGLFDLDYRVDDDWGGRSVTRTFQVNALAGNQDPTLVGVLNGFQLEQFSGTFVDSISATDPEGQSVTFSQAGGPSWIQVVTTSSALRTGEVRYRTSEAPSPGPQTVSVRATDSAGGTDTEFVSMTLLAPGWPLMGVAGG
jgi:hypothetical protein